MSSSSLSCPVCSLALTIESSEKSFSCPNGHLFDRAKQGYLNLLLPQFKKSKHPGDTVEMVAARARFLNASYYQNIATQLVELIGKLQTANDTNFIKYCDIACGEGYYTSFIKRALFNDKPNAETVGIDISLPAIKAACRRDKSIQWLIASLAHLPLSPASQDLITVLFCRSDLELIARSLLTNGFLIIAETGPNHLKELREQLYDIVKPDNDKQGKDIQTLTHIDTLAHQEIINLKTSSDIIDLLTMTPHYWRAKPEKKEALSSLHSLSVTLDIRFLVFQKHA